MKKIEGLKQNLNGRQGEDRTRQIIGKKIIYIEKSADFDGTDFEVELTPENYSTESRYKIFVKARVQCNFFEGNNEVKIARNYVEDEEGVRTDFFALLHTDEGEEEVCYFFSSDEIKKAFKLRHNKEKGIEYFVFRLSNTRKYANYKNKTKLEINRRIEQGIRNTEEYRNQRFIRAIEEEYKRPEINIFENENTKLAKDIRDKSIVDKIYFMLEYYKDFRRITSWRLVEKLSFDRNQNASTYYNQFSLHTNNKEIIDFFKKITIDTKVKVLNKVSYKNVEDLDFKINRIIDVLNYNLIVSVKEVGSQKIIKIDKPKDVKCLCVDCEFDRLAINNGYAGISKESEASSEWELMQIGYYYSWLGMFELSKETFQKAANLAKNNKEEVCFFLARNNVRITANKNFEYNLPNLENELATLNVAKDKQKILESIFNGTLISDYAKAVDELYLNLKDLKQRAFVTDTSSLIQRLYCKVVEFVNYVKGNWIIAEYSASFNPIVEKFIEGCLISYSMNTGHSSHLVSLNETILKLAIHHCDPRKLLKFFQQDQLKMVKSDAGEYMKECLGCFFAKDNLDFLQQQICSSENNVLNAELRRKIERIFENICLVIAYTDIDFNSVKLTSGIVLFIEKIGIDSDVLSSVAHMLICRIDSFSTREIKKLINTVMSNENLQKGYLLTNCLFALKDKKYSFTKSDDKLVDNLINTIEERVRYDLLRALPHLISDKQKSSLISKIESKLKNEFDHDLYYHALKNNCLSNPLLDFDTYLSVFNRLSGRSDLLKYYSKSPYTGVSELWSRELNRVTEIILILGIDTVIKHPFVQDLINDNPYYNFILGDYEELPTDFKMDWVLENQSEIVLNHLRSNSKLKARIKESLLQRYDKSLSRIYLKYFA